MVCDTWLLILLRGGRYVGESRVMRVRSLGRRRGMGVKAEEALDEFTGDRGHISVSKNGWRDVVCKIFESDSKAGKRLQENQQSIYARGSEADQ